jgi:hypothetical protein
MYMSQLQHNLMSELSSDKKQVKLTQNAMGATCRLQLKN